MTPNPQNPGAVAGEAAIQEALGAETVSAMAFAFVAATKKRAQARSHLSALRRKWLQDYDMFFDKTESRGEEGYQTMMEAIKAREQRNADYRRIKSRLFRACKQEAE